MRIADYYLASGDGRGLAEIGRVTDGFALQFVRICLTVV
jgi:hypothetical protein